MFSSDFGFEIINVDDLSLQEEKFLPSELLAYARDENESSFVRDIEGHLTLVYQLLDTQGHVDDVRHVPRVIPVTLFLKEDGLFVLANHKNIILVKKALNRVEKVDSPKHLLLSLVTAFSKQYFDVLDTISEERDKLINDLRKRPNKSNLARLANLQSGTVHLMMGTKQNFEMLTDLQNIEQDKENTRNEKMQLQDAIIEARQLSNMCSLNSQVFQELSSSSYNNVLSNNLNDNVTTLTIISIGISIIAMVTSFYGMNVKLPFDSVDAVWVLIILITTIITIMLSIVMYIYVHKEDNHPKHK
ncbi:TPA: magnesium transporter CorA family protein [Streptococcus agalactiae]